MTKKRSKIRLENGTDIFRLHLKKDHRKKCRFDFW